jgi:hypothetical protein
MSQGPREPGSPSGEVMRAARNDGGAVLAYHLRSHQAATGRFTALPPAAPSKLFKTILSLLRRGPGE